MDSHTTIINKMHERFIPVGTMLNHVVDMYEIAYSHERNNHALLRESCQDYMTFATATYRLSNTQRQFINTLIELCIDREKYNKFQKHYKRLVNRSADKDFYMSIGCLIGCSVYNIVYKLLGPNWNLFFHIIPIVMFVYMMYIAFRRYVVGYANVDNFHGWNLNIPGNRLVCFQ